MNTVILHATAHLAGTPFGNVLRYLQNTSGTGKPLSYHYLIDKDGTIVKGCPAAKCAFHAGKSVGPQGSLANEYSLGISFYNQNDGTDPYTKDQYEAARELILALKEQFESLTYLAAHYGVSWGRKTDPRGFPIMELAQAVALVPWKTEDAAWLTTHSRALVL